MFSNMTVVLSNHIKSAWEEGLCYGVDPGGVERRDGEDPFGCQINAPLQLIQFKVMQRLHYSKEKINRISKYEL